MTTESTGIVAAATATFCVGTSAAIAPLLHQYPVYGGQALRYAGGAIALLVIMGAARLPHLRLSLREVLLIVALSGTGLAAFNVFVVEATRHADPAMVGTIVAAVPVLLALSTPLMQRQPPRARLVFAAVIVTAGAVLLAGLGRTSALGLGLAVGALVCEAAFSLLAVPLLPRLGAVRVSAYSAVAAVPLLLVTGLLVQGEASLRVPTVVEAGALLYLATVVTAFAFFCWYSSLPKLGAEKAGLFSGFIPVGALASSMLLGTGHPGLAEIGGIAVVVAGLLAGMWPTRQARRTRAVRAG